MIQAETLSLLEWQRLCQHLATFAATKLGAIAARRLQVPDVRAQSEHLLAQTREIYWLEQQTDNNWSFEGIQDVGAALERADRGGLSSGDELLALASTLAGVRRLRRTIDEREEELPTLLAMVAQVRTYPELEQEIYRCIDESGDVSERASPQLAGIRRQLKERRDRIYQILHRILQRHSGAVQQATISQRQERFVIPVKAPQKDTIPGIVHDASSTGATLYVEPSAIVELGNQMRAFRRREQAEEEAILRALSDRIRDAYEDLEHLLAVATALDLATAKARYAWWLEANSPRFIAPGETTTLRRLRHPLLVWQQQHEQGSQVVPIDVVVRPSTRVVAITGPNTGGKTVTLKTIALAALMAKVGMFVPAREPVELPWFQEVLADIGDEQCIEQSLSTFSSHIRRIERIIAAIQASTGSPSAISENGDESSDVLAGENSREENNIHPSLVLLDEVGAGTDPAEGSALAIALLQYLAARVQLTVATTHYGELKSLKYQDSRFENASVEFDETTLSPTYRLLWGIPGRSNALTVARRLGLESEIVDRAQEKVGGYSEEINQTIAGLEAQRRQQEAKAAEASQLLEQAEAFYREVSDRAAALQQREQDLKRSQEEAVRNAILAAKEEIAKVIRELQQGKPKAQDAQKATNALNEIAQRHLPQAPKPAKPSYRPQVGEKVRIPRLGQTAEVLDVPDSDEGELTVRFGLMKMNVPLSDIESLDGKTVEVSKPPTRLESDSRRHGLVHSAPKATTPKSAPAPKSPAPLVRTSKNTFDIRGSRVADAQIELDKAIAEGEGALWIIHGKGTGKLRQGVHEFLKQHPRIERFELADPKEGGAGVTVVYLK